MKKYIRKHYHWVLALAMLLHMAVYTGLSNNSGLFVVPVTEELGISRSSYSLAMIPRNLIPFLLLMFSGPFIRKWGYRRMATIVLPLGGLGYFVFSKCSGMGGLWLGAILLGISAGFCSTHGINRVISDWFHRHCGTVLGVVSAASGVGGSLCCIALSDAIEKGSWRNGYLLAMLLTAILFVLNICIVRDRPEDMGLLPYGEGEHFHKTKQEAGNEEVFPGYTFHELVRKPVFYFTLVIMLFTYLCVYLPFAVIVPHLRDCGLTEEQAVLAQSTMLLSLSATKILFGYLMDVIGVRRVTVLCCLCAAASMCVLATVSGVAGGFVAIILYSMALPVAAITMPLITMEMFGHNSYIMIIGIFSSTVSIGSMTASIVSNAVFDIFGSYSPGFWAGAAMMLVLLAGYLVLFGTVKKEKTKWRMSHES